MTCGDVDADDVIGGDDEDDDTDGLRYLPCPPDWRPGSALSGRPADRP